MFSSGFNYLIFAFLFFLAAQETTAASFTKKKSPKKISNTNIGHCKGDQTSVIDKLESSLGTHIFTAKDACSDSEFEKNPCETCADKEPSFNRGLTDIRKIFMSNKNMEARLLKAKAKLWTRKLEQVFHNTLYFDAVAKDPTLKKHVLHGTGH